MWQCRPNCSECCGTFPIEKQLYDIAVAEGLLQVKPNFYKEGVLSDTDHTIFVAAKTEDAHCVFLIRATHQCAIYSRRPRICRIYGTVAFLLCPYIDMTGKPRTPSEVKRVTRVVNKQVDKRLKDVQRRMEQYDGV